MSKITRQSSEFHEEIHRLERIHAVDEEIANIQPPANSVPVGTTFVIANAELDSWISNGTDWVVIRGINNLFVEEGELLDE